MAKSKSTKKVLKNVVAKTSKNKQKTAVKKKILNKSSNVRRNLFNSSNNRTVIIPSSNTQSIAFNEDSTKGVLGASSTNAEMTNESVIPLKPEIVLEPRIDLNVQKYPLSFMKIFIGVFVFITILAIISLAVFLIFSFNVMSLMN